MKKILLGLVCLLLAGILPASAAETNPGQVVVDFWSLAFHQRDFAKAYLLLGTARRAEMSQEQFVATLGKMFDMDAAAKNMVGDQDAAKLRAVKFLLDAAMENARFTVLEETINGDKAVVKVSMKITSVSSLVTAADEKSPLTELAQFQGSDEELKAKVSVMISSLPVEEEIDTFDLIKENGEWRIDESI